MRKAAFAGRTTDLVSTQISKNAPQILGRYKQNKAGTPGGSGRKVGPNDVETNQQVSPRLRLKSMGLRQPRDCLMRSRLYQCR